MKTSTKFMCLFPFYKIKTCGNSGRLVLKKNVFKLTMLVNVPGVLFKVEIFIGRSGLEKNGGS